MRNGRSVSLSRRRFVALAGSAAAIATLNFQTSTFKFQPEARAALSANRLQKETI